MSTVICSMRTQVSIEDRRYDAPATAAPTEPQVDPPPDVVPHPVYDDLNTLTRKVISAILIYMIPSTCIYEIGVHVYTLYIAVECIVILCALT